jgi:hypothetical protein
MGTAVVWEASTSTAVENFFSESGFVIENAFDLEE